MIADVIAMAVILGIGPAVIGVTVVCVNWHERPFRLKEEDESLDRSIRHYEEENNRLDKQMLAQGMV